MIIDIIKLNYDKYASLIDGPLSEVTITERDSGASFHFLHVKNCRDVKMFLFPTEYIKDMERTTEKVSSRLLDSNCDGTIFFYSQENILHVILAELKSCPPGSGLSKAFKQLVYSFLKYFSFLSICKEWVVDNLTLDFVISCNCSEHPDDLESEMLSIESDVDELLGSKDTKCVDFNTTIFPSLYLAPNKSIQLCFSDLQLLQDLQLNDNIANKLFTLHLAMSPTISDDFADIVFDY